MGIETTTRGIRYGAEARRGSEPVRRPVPSVRPPDRAGIRTLPKVGERLALKPLERRAPSPPVRSPDRRGIRPLAKPVDKSPLRPFERRSTPPLTRPLVKPGNSPTRDYLERVGRFDRTASTVVKKDQLAPETDEEIIKAYGINFVTDGSWNLHLIIKALIVYPRDFFQGTNTVKEVRFCNLRRQNVWGDYDVKLDEIRIETDIDNRRKDSIFHHEYYHKLDLGTGKGIEFRKQWEEKFPRRSTLKLLLYRVLRKEIPNFQKYIGKRYKTGGEFDRIWGFASRYGQHSAKEDRATVAQMILSEPERLNSLLKTEDVTLKEKVQYMMSFYNKMSRGKMDSIFWADFAEGKVDANYWRKRSY